MKKSPSSRWRRSFISALVFAIVVAISVPLAAPSGSAQAATMYGSYTYNQAIQTIFNATNQNRIANGLPALRMTTGMNNLAQGWTDTMARENRMYHNPNLAASAPSGWTRLAENVAAGYAVAGVVPAWMGSPGHRANILNAQYQYIGIGVSKSADGRIYYTQNFARFSATPSGIISDNYFESPLAGIPTERLSGSDRYATAIQVSRKFAPGVPVVYVANGLNYPDALSASPAAAHRNGALLLTAAASVPASVLAEIRRLAPAEIVVVGGTGVVSVNAYNQLRSIQPNIRRDAGADRYSTSAVLSSRAFGTNVAHAYLVTGANYPDALAASAAAGSSGSPVVLIQPGASLTAANRATLVSLGVDRVTIVGGTGALSTGIERGLRTLLGTENVTRISGASRSATSAAVNNATFTSASEAFLAFEGGFADSLGGSALAGGLDAPLYLVPSSCIPKAVSDSMLRLGVTKINLLGGTGVLSTAVENVRVC